MRTHKAEPRLGPETEEMLRAFLIEADDCNRSTATKIGEVIHGITHLAEEKIERRIA